MRITDVNRMISTLENQFVENITKEMQQEIDREVLWAMLLELGWTRVMIDRSQDNKHAVDITYWLSLNCQGAYERNGRDFIFENEKDASWFILRWS
jgi:hypothetical protein